MAWLSLLLFLPWFALLGALYWFYPRQPRPLARRAFDTSVLVLALLLSVAGMHWGYAEGVADTRSGPIWRQVLAVLNKVNFGRNKYYYSRYYGHQYKNYYAESPAA